MKQNKKSVLAVILARGGSKGIKKKNIKKIQNHPLISYSIYAGKNSKLVDEIIVSSDSKEIINVSKNYGADAPFVRPKILSGDKVPSVTALKHAVLEAEKFYGKTFEYIIELPCVSPLRDKDDINAALNILIKKKVDSVISYVNTGEKHPTRLKRIKANKVTNFCKDYPEPDIGSRRQDFEPCYIRNGAIYSMTRNTLIKKNSRNGEKSIPYIMSDEKSINIDTKFDFEIAKMLIENGRCNNFPHKVFNFKKTFNEKKNKINLLVTSPMEFLIENKRELEKNFNVYYGYKININQIKKIINKFDAWICHPSPKFLIDKNLLRRAKNLKIIITPSTGTNHISLKDCKKKNIKVMSIRNNRYLKSIKASSEFSFTLLLAAFKNLYKGIIYGKSANWRESEEYLRGNQLNGKTLGIVGFGRIGSNIAKYADAFGMNVFAYDPFLKIKNPKIKQFSNINKMLSKCDAVNVCIHLNKKNYHFFDKKKLNQLKKNCILVNTSRGEIIDEKNLVKLIKSKKIKFFAADVVSQEHKLPTSRSKIFDISHFENVYITPHMAGLTYESEEIASKICINNLKRFFKIKN